MRSFPPPPPRLPVSLSLAPTPGLTPLWQEPRLREEWAQKGQKSGRDHRWLQSIPRPDPVRRQNSQLESSFPWCLLRPGQGRDGALRGARRGGSRVCPARWSAYKALLPSALRPRRTPVSQWGADSPSLPLVSGPRPAALWFCVLSGSAQPPTRQQRRAGTGTIYWAVTQWVPEKFCLRSFKIRVPAAGLRGPQELANGGVARPRKAAPRLVQASPPAPR